MALDVMARVCCGKMWAFSFHVVELSHALKFVWAQKLEEVQYFDVFSCFVVCCTVIVASTDTNWGCCMMADMCGIVLQLSAPAKLVQ